MFWFHFGREPTREGRLLIFFTRKLFFNEHGFSLFDEHGGTRKTRKLTIYTEALFLTNTDFHGNTRKLSIYTEALFLTNTDFHGNTRRCSMQRSLRSDSIRTTIVLYESHECSLCTEHTELTETLFLHGSSLFCTNLTNVLYVRSTRNSRKLSFYTDALFLHRCSLFDEHGFSRKYTELYAAL